LVKVNIRIEAFSVNDPYWRYHGKAVNQTLNADFWTTQPEKMIGTSTTRSFSHEQTVDLPAGSHYVIYGNSSIEEYKWHARIYVDGRLIAEGDVHRRSFLRADFTVGVPPIPAPPIPWIQVFMISLPIILGLGLTATSGAA